MDDKFSYNKLIKSFKGLSSQCSDSTTWAFERFPNKDLIEGKFADNAEGTISLEKCLTSCLNGFIFNLKYSFDVNL